MDYQKVGQRIRAIRKKKNLSQKKLAKEAGVGISHISHIENGNTQMSVEVLANICKFLDVSADELLYGHTYHYENHLVGDMVQLLSDCNNTELDILMELIKNTKISLRKVYPQK